MEDRVPSPLKSDFDLLKTKGVLPNGNCSQESQTSVTMVHLDLIVYTKLMLH